MKFFIFLKIKKLTLLKEKVGKQPIFKKKIFLKKFTKVFMRDGNFKKTNYLMSSVFTLFKNYFLRSTFFKRSLRTIGKKINIFDNEMAFYKFNDLIYYLGKFIACAYSVSAIPIPKKLKRKKKKAKFIFKLKYVRTQIRERVAMKWLKHSVLYYNNRKILIKLYKSIVNTCVEGKNSNLFKKKLHLYKKIFGKVAK